MAELKIRLDCIVTGPLSDGTAIQAAEDWAERTSEALAERGVELLGQVRMDKSGRSRGGFASQLHTVRKSRSEVTIPGPMVRGVVWAPWLEGTSQRNTSTGFKGYHLFRKTRAQLQKEAPRIGQEQLDKLMAGIGGA